jgi:hypothetical protein
MWRMVAGMGWHDCEDLKMNGRITKWALKKEDFKVETEFSLIHTQSSIGREHGNQLLGPINSETVLAGRVKASLEGMHREILLSLSIKRPPPQGAATCIEKDRWILRKFWKCFRSHPQFCKSVSLWEVCFENVNCSRWTVSKLCHPPPPLHKLQNWGISLPRQKWKVAKNVRIILCIGGGGGVELTQNFKTTALACLAYCVREWTF